MEIITTAVVSSIVSVLITVYIRDLQWREHIARVWLDEECEKP